MTITSVLFVQGGGKGAHSVDASLAESLKRALGPKYDLHFPRMPREADPNVASWKQKISSELSRIPGKVILVAHSVGGSILLRYLAEEKVEKPIAGVFLLAAPSWDEDRWNFEDRGRQHGVPVPAWRRGAQSDRATRVELLRERGPCLPLLKRADEGQLPSQRGLAGH